MYPILAIRNHLPHVPFTTAEIPDCTIKAMEDADKGPVNLAPCFLFGVSLFQ